MSKQRELSMKHDMMELHNIHGEKDYTLVLTLIKTP
jgi:hypothetical protein